MQYVYMNNNRTVFTVQLVFGAFRKLAVEVREMTKISYHDVHIFIEIQEVGLNLNDIRIYE